MAELHEFLIFAAQNGYAKADVEKLREDDGSASIKIAKGAWLAHDNYYTSNDGRRFEGSMVVFLASRALWTCTYTGFVAQEADPGEVYGFLSRAIIHPEPELPVRGPWQYTEPDWEYTFAKSDLASILDNFVTVESIRYSGNQVYEGVFHGGKMD